MADLAFLDFAGARADLRLRVVAAIFVTVSLEFKTSEMIEHAVLQVSLARVLLVAVRGQNFHYCQKKVPLEQKAVPAKNGIHVFPTIFTSAAGFSLASRDKKVTYVTQRFFWRRREVTPVVYVRDSTRVHPSCFGAGFFTLCSSGYKVDIYRTVNGQTAYGQWPDRRGPAPKNLSLKLACTKEFFYAAT